MEGQMDRQEDIETAMQCRTMKCSVMYCSVVQRNHNAMQCRPTVV